MCAERDLHFLKVCTTGQKRIHYRRHASKRPFSLVQLQIFIIRNARHYTANNHNKERVAAIGADRYSKIHWMTKIGVKLYLWWKHDRIVVKKTWKSGWIKLVWWHLSYPFCSRMTENLLNYHWSQEPTQSGEHRHIHPISYMAQKSSI